MTLIKKENEVQKSCSAFSDLRNGKRNQAPSFLQNILYATSLFISSSDRISIARISNTWHTCQFFLLPCLWQILQSNHSFIPQHEVYFRILLNIPLSQYQAIQVGTQDNPFVSASTIQAFVLLSAFPNCHAIPSLDALMILFPSFSLYLPSSWPFLKLNSS